MFESIFSPIQIGFYTLKNRIIFAPTTLGLKTEEYEAKIREIAQGDAAMIIIGDVPVSTSGNHSLHSKKGFSYYQRLCQIIHQEGCLVSAQIHQSDSNFKGLIRYIPGFITGKVKMEDLRPLLNQEAKKLINSLSEQKVSRITTAFGSAAQLAKQAGFDMIQIHGDRMCGSFFSSLFNERKDRYGGSVTQRTQFARECIEAVKNAVDLPIDFKLVVRQENPHYGNAGVLEEELAVVVPILEKAGVQSFHVTLANHSNLSDPIPAGNHPEFKAEGCFLKFCEEVGKYTHLPLCGVGGLSHPEFIDEQIKNGRIQCAAMSRQLIADAQWPNKVKENHIDQIHYCVRCNKDCLGGMMNHRGVHCIFQRRNEK